MSALIVVPCTILTTGTYLSQVPYLGAVGTFVWPTLIGPALIFVLVGTLLAVSAWWLGSRRLAPIVAGAGILALAGTSVVFGSQVRIAADAGVPVTPRVFSLPLETALPDSTVTYMTDDTGAPLTMDMYRPSDSVEQPPSGAPIVVYVHGGGWIGGDPKEVSADLRWFADQGYWVVSPAYTLATESHPTWDTAMPQIGCALAWVADHAAEYEADASRLAVWGSSAGGNLALTTTYAAASGQLSPACGGDVPNVRAVGGAVPAVDPAYVYDNADPLTGPATRHMVATFIGGTAEQYPERLRAVQAATYISPQAPPTFLLIGQEDRLVPVEGTRRFVERAADAGVDVTTLYWPWADHSIAVGHNYLPNQTLIHRLLDHFRSNGV
ncbi:alpha/beta hydrolase [Mycolicibacterium setense]